VILRYVHELTVPEIASSLGTNEGTIHSRLHYARKALLTAGTRLERRLMTFRIVKHTMKSGAHRCGPGPALDAQTQAALDLHLADCADVASTRRACKHLGVA